MSRDSFVRDCAKYGDTWEVVHGRARVKFSIAPYDGQEMARECIEQKTAGAGEVIAGSTAPCPYPTAW
eukprot:CAMPEP_0179006146 /NCGR_PEP_ID=MMETSP0795-20121207/14372_1 /TAXON_ID=88552 /ORGANISM="Amoebophrya sp., Strain Ameob2" /LENGTH=67 /DNA_ID=CAMNT_0020700835 /DNA_START=484 /DNA_END=684 /DNA_ORIENTATION=-